jgi:hypothetical protein
LSNEISRRTFFKTAASLSGGTALGSLGFALYEPHELQVEHVEIRLRRLPPAFDGFRLVQLSDIHFGEYMTLAYLQKVIETANAQQPDLVLLTGDYVTAPSRRSQRNKRALEIWPCAEALRNLHARFGRVAILGNHDCHTNPEIITEALRDNQHTVLRNQAIPIETNGTRFWLAGLEDVLKQHPDPESTLHSVPAGECVVAAVHEPDYADELRKYPVDFVAAGHSHGGQVRFPGIGTVYLPEGAQKYPLGHYQLGELQLYTNRGIGVIGLPVRFLCPPELTVFTLRNEHSAKPAVSILESALRQRTQQLF